MNPPPDAPTPTAGPAGRAGSLVRRALLVLLGAALVAAAGALVYQRSFAQGEHNLKAATNSRLDLFASVVEARVRRLEPVPATIQLNPAVLSLLRAPEPARERAANDYLARLNAHLGSVAVSVA